MSASEAGPESVTGGRGLRLILAAGLLVVVGTGSLEGQVVPPEGSVETVVVGEPELADRVRSILPHLMARTGLPAPDTLAVERTDRGAVESFLEARLDAEWPRESAEARSRVLHLLGALPPGTDLREEIRRVYRDEVAGFYDPSDATVRVLGGQGDEVEAGTLIHEVVHALQDAATPLQLVMGPEVPADRRWGVRGALEAHATLISVERMAGLLPAEADDPLARLPELSSLVRIAVEAMVDDSPPLAEAPSFVRGLLLFPYREGVEFVTGLWAEAGRPVAPLGERLPGSTRDVLHPSVPFEQGGPPVTPGLPPEPPPDHEGVFGALGAALVLEAAGASESRRRVDGWMGDRFVLDRDGERVRWLILWEDAGNEEAFRAGMGQALEGAPGEGTVRGPVSLAGTDLPGTLICAWAPGTDSGSCTTEGAFEGVESASGLEPGTGSGFGPQGGGR